MLSELQPRVIHGLISKADPEDKIARMIQERKDRIASRGSSMNRTYVKNERRDRLYKFLSMLTHGITLKELCAVEALAYKKSACNSDLIALCAEKKAYWKEVLTDYKNVTKRMYFAIKGRE